MSLTQERINEIAMECWNYYLTNASSFTVTDTYNHFLSRIREEQEPYGYRIENHASIVFTRNKEIAENGGGFPLFAIPPVAPESDCKELVEALEIIRKGDDSPRTIAMVALAKHKASMGEK